MRRLAHISDLHFGTESAAVAEGLLRDIDQFRPALVVVSGDLTQRARGAQFRAARDYLRRIHFPQLVIPGNHDVPFYDVIRRFLAPTARYRKYIHAELNPWLVGDEIAVLGLNTARSLTWKSGRISREQMELVRARFGAVLGEEFRIVVTHHPFIPPPGDEKTGVELVGRARLAIQVLDECQVDLLLAGHLHHGYTGDVRAFYPATRRSMVAAQAGTAISQRIRNEPNAYNQILLDHDHLAIVVRVWNGSEFAETVRASYRLTDQEWGRV